MSEKSLQDRHCDAGIPVVCAEGVTEPMLAEAWNPQACAHRPQVSPPEAAVTERRSYGTWEEPSGTRGSHLEPMVQGGDEA